MLQLVGDMTLHLKCVSALEVVALSRDLISEFVSGLTLHLRFGVPALSGGGGVNNRVLVRTRIFNFLSEVVRLRAI